MAVSSALVASATKATANHGNIASPVVPATGSSGRYTLFLQLFDGGGSVPTVSSVAGGGLAWTFDTEVFISGSWRALIYFADGDGDGSAVTATFGAATADASIIAIYRSLGTAGAEAAVINSGTSTGPNAALTGSAGIAMIGYITGAPQTVAPDVGWTEDLDTNATANLGMETQHRDSPITHAGATLGSSRDWIVLVVPLIDPLARPTFMLGVEAPASFEARAALQPAATSFAPSSYPPSKTNILPQATRCQLTTLPLDTLLDAQAAVLRLSLIRFLWNQDTIPSYAPQVVQQLGLTIPDEPMSGSAQLTPANYSMDNAASPPRRIAGDFTTANLDHYERWIMRAAPNVPNSYLNFGIPWGRDLIPGIDEGFVPVLYFAPTTPTSKMFIVHDGHGPYNFTGHRALIKWALDHGFGVLQIIMPEFGHNLLSGFDDLYPQFAPFGHIHRIFFEATASAITYAQALGYSTFVMEGISGGGLTAHWMASLDLRISVSWPIAGAWPFAMRLTPANQGDWEQLKDPPGSPVYSLVDFTDLFALSASNGRHATQITHEFDPVCFAASGHEAEIAAYTLAADARASGRFRSIIALGQNVHDVLPFSIQAIEDECRELGIIP
jgi:hypothetical protein